MTSVQICRRIARACLFTVSLGALTAVAQASAAKVPFTIPVIVSLTGTLSFSGNDYLQTTRVFEHFINEHGGIQGTPVHFNVLDDETNPQVSVQLFNSLVDAHPSVVMGPGQTAGCAAIGPLIEHGPVLYCFSPGYSPPRTGFAFASSVALSFIQPAMVRYMRLVGYRRLAMISVTDASGQTNESATVAAVGLPENAGLKIVANQHFTASDTSIAAQIANIKAANPDVVIIWANGTAFGTVLRTLKDAGLDLPTVTTGANLNQTLMRQFNALAPRTLLFNGSLYFGGNALRSGPLRSRIDDFYAAFKEMGKVPTPSAGFAWDPLLIVTEALKTLGTTATAPQLAEYLNHLHGFPGISGIYNFRDDHHGLTDSSVTMVKWNSATQTFATVSRGGGIPYR